MSQMDALTPVGELVARRPGRAGVFERFGIDYCCGGHLPLVEACRQQKLKLEEVVTALESADRAPADPESRDWTATTLTELADHIVGTHHQYLRTELPRLTALLDKVAGVHGSRHPELHDCKRVFAGMRAELESHMAKEETVLFPLIAEMESERTVRASHCGTVRNPIQVMEAEHDSAGNALASLRQLTAGYAVPEDGCTSYRILLQALSGLELDLHQHIHKENNILFPRAIQLEEDIAQGVGTLC